MKWYSKFIARTVVIGLSLVWGLSAVASDDADQKTDQKDDCADATVSTFHNGVYEDVVEGWKRPPDNR